MKSFDDIEKKYPLSVEENDIINLKIQLLQKLIELRKDKQITQQELANLCGFKRSFVARFECDLDRSMSIETFLKIVSAMGCEISLVPKTC